jgi:hypothetical protein
MPTFDRTAEPTVFGPCSEILIAIQGLSSKKDPLLSSLAFEVRINDITIEPRQYSCGFEEEMKSGESFSQ